MLFANEITTGPELGVVNVNVRGVVVPPDTEIGGLGVKVIPEAVGVTVVPTFHIPPEGVKVTVTVFPGSACVGLALTAKVVAYARLRL